MTNEEEQREQSIRKHHAELKTEFKESEVFRHWKEKDDILGFLDEARADKKTLAAALTLYGEQMAEETLLLAEMRGVTFKVTPAFE